VQSEFFEKVQQLLVVRKVSTMELYTLLSLSEQEVASGEYLNEEREKLLLSFDEFCAVFWRLFEEPSCHVIDIYDYLFDFFSCYLLD